MRRIELLPTIVIFCFVFFAHSAFSQQDLKNMGYINSIVDSLGRKGIIAKNNFEKPNIKFTNDQALKYLIEKYKSADWENPEDPLRKAIGELIFVASHQRFDSLNKYLQSVRYDSIDMPWFRFFKWDSMRLKVPVLMPAPFSMVSDSVARWDTINIAGNSDTAALKAWNLLPDSLKHYRKAKPAPSVILKDTVFMIATNTLPEVARYKKTQPFKTYRFPFLADSISEAVKALSGFIIAGDSSKINFREVSGLSVPVWLNSKSDRMARYWLRNEFDDSVIVWVGGTGRDTIGLFLEEGIMFRRPSKQTNISNAQLSLKHVNSGDLQKVNKAYIKPILWRFHTQTNFILSQTYLTNWASGGQSSVSMTLDATGFADYKNDDLKLLSNNFIRLKYGLIKPGQEYIRKSDDLLETNSKIGHKAFGKFNFTGIMLFKTQISAGYDYQVSRTKPVSNFMNPASLTLGLGLEYKPEKKTSINFAPLSYKATFVLDTVKYDEVKYGLAKNKRVLQEPGASLQITNEFSPIKSVTIINRLQLFTNYINKPQNVVVDWEMIATAKLNWFTEIRFNTHLIYDDKILIPLVYNNGTPRLGPDGKQEKGKRLQFKELMGFSFVFRF